MRRQTSNDESPPLARDAIAVLREQRVGALRANAAGVVDGPRIGVRSDHADAMAEAPGSLETE
jgi:hypothetical protein